MSRSAAHGFVRGAMAATAAMAAALWLFGGIARADGCANAGLRSQQGAAALADCRAWELASPVANNTGDVFPNFGTIQSSVDGGAAKWVSTAAIDGNVAAPIFTAYLSRRESNGWSTASLDPPTPVDALDQINYGLFLGLSDDLSHEAFRSGYALVPGARDGQSNLYLRNTVTGAVSLATPPALDPLDFDSLISSVWLSGASKDFTKVFFEAEKQFTPDAIGSFTPNLYEYDADGHLSVVGILPDGTVAPGGAGAGTGSVSSTVSDERPVSDDGSRVFFTTPATAGGEFGGAATGEIYQRVDGQTTVAVSRSGLSSDPNGAQPAMFWFGSRDGTKAVFTSAEKLTPDATTGPSDGGNDLYLWTAGAAPALVDLAPDTSDANGAEVLGVLGTSDDLSYVYFAAKGALAPGATAGADNLYVWHAGGGGGTVTYIADGIPATNWDNGSFGIQNRPPYSSPHEPLRTARVTPDGQHLLFAATTDVAQTGYDNAGHQELFLFTVGAGRPVCVSCNPSGMAATGDAEFLTHTTAGAGPSGFGAGPRPLSQDGRRVFFTSSDRLAPQDVNEQPDVYEWHDGQISLISSGTSSDPSFFEDASASGDDVFFATYQRLAGIDRNGNRDLYDARVGGGIAAQNPAPPPAACAGDSCRPGPTGPPVLPVAGSITFFGTGNASSAGAATPKPRKPRVTVRKTVIGTVAALKVGVPGKGRITASASGIRGVRKTTTRAATYTLKIALTPRARKALASRHQLKVRVKLAFASAAGGQSSVTVVLTFKQPHGKGR